MKPILTGLIFAVVFVTSVAAVELGGAFTQGGYLLGRVVPGSTVTLNDQKVFVRADGYFVYGFHRRFEGPANLKVGQPDGKVVRQVLPIQPRNFPTQHITGVPRETVHLSQVNLARAKKERVAIHTARSGMGEMNDFLQCCQWPVSSTVTGVFGSRRTFEGEERSWHKGADVAAPVGTPVSSAAPGTVTFASNTFFSGNLVILDHGAGLFSQYAHLEEIRVKTGQKVTQNDTIGTVGMTGRATGPHLHWALYWKQTPLDPILWLKRD
jgi:murein DD-endopeptidase MepM/ murein hydrolase activator NlpD